MIQKANKEGVYFKPDIDWTGMIVLYNGIRVGMLKKMVNSLHWFPDTDIDVNAKELISESDVLADLIDAISQTAEIFKLEKVTIGHTIGSFGQWLEEDVLLSHGFVIGHPDDNPPVYSTTFYQRFI